MGYFFQRPEMLRIHHEYGKPQNNYGDITWWDMLFDTYQNPKEFNSRSGFYATREEEPVPMLTFRDVNK